MKRLIGLVVIPSALGVIIGLVVVEMRFSDDGSFVKAQIEKLLE